MDIDKALRELHLEKQRLDKVIATLEGLSTTPEKKSKSRRGRKNMPASERKQVSERMRKYWAAKRARNSVSKITSNAA